MHHVPFELVPGDHDFCAHKPAGSFTHGCKCFGEYLIQNVGSSFTELSLYTAATVTTTELIINLFTFGGISSIALALLELRNFCFQLTGCFANALAEFFGLRTQLTFRNI